MLIVILLNVQLNKHAITFSGKEKTEENVLIFASLHTSAVATTNYCLSVCLSVSVSARLSLGHFIGYLYVTLDLCLSVSIQLCAIQSPIPHLRVWVACFSLSVCRCLCSPCLYPCLGVVLCVCFGPCPFLLWYMSMLKRHFHKQPSSSNMKMVQRSSRLRYILLGGPTISWLLKTEAQQ